MSFVEGNCYHGGQTHVDRLRHYWPHSGCTSFCLLIEETDFWRQSKLLVPCQLIWNEGLMWHLPQLAPSLARERPMFDITDGTVPPMVKILSTSGQIPQTVCPEWCYLWLYTKHIIPFVKPHEGTHHFFLKYSLVSRMNTSDFQYCNQSALIQVAINSFLSGVPHSNRYHS